MQRTITLIGGVILPFPFISFFLSYFSYQKKKLKWTKNELRILEKARALKLFDFKGMKFSKIVEIIR